VAEAAAQASTTAAASTTATARESDIGDYFYRWILVVTYIFIDEHKNLSGYWAIGAIADFVWEKIWIAKERRNENREGKLSQNELPGYPRIRIKSQPK